MESKIGIGCVKFDFITLTGENSILINLKILPCDYKMKLLR